MTNFYNNKKAKYAYELFLKGLPFKKVYAAVKKGNKYVVLTTKRGKRKYQLSGGGVDDGEDNITAIKREVLEELNMNISIIKSLGIVNYTASWKYENKDFEVKYEAEIFLTEFTSYGNNNNFGLPGEFLANDIISIAEISEKDLLKHVAEFAKNGFNLSLI